MLDVVNKEGKALSGAGFTRGVRLNHTMRLRLANKQKAANSPHVRTLTGSIPGTGFGVVFNRIMVDAIRGASESA
ncbi:hypothetical protein MCOR06_009917 [Pyricularia oryzae]|nr:hypothetical protein MCOR15_010611 [Pyricularia oryzae]KAI6579730.1 hypothetical protein MCOR06_009917 [Pyricularia oryzae]